MSRSQAITPHPHLAITPHPHLNHSLTPVDPDAHFKKKKRCSSFATARISRVNFLCVNKRVVVTIEKFCWLHSPLWCQAAISRNTVALLSDHLFAFDSWINWFDSCICRRIKKCDSRTGQRERFASLMVPRTQLLCWIESVSFVFISLLVFRPNCNYRETWWLHTLMLWWNSCKLENVFWENCALSGCCVYETPLKFMCIYLKLFRNRFCRVCQW